MHIWLFSKNEAEFLGWITGIKLGKYKINFGVVVVSDMCIFCALCEEVQLRLCHSQHAVQAESVLTREPGLSAQARLYGQTVFTVCVCVCVCVRLRRPVSTARLCSLSLYIVNVFLSFTSLTAQVACRGVFSI